MQEFNYSQSFSAKVSLRRLTLVDFLINVIIPLFKKKKKKTHLYPDLRALNVKGIYFFHQYCSLSYSEPSKSEFNRVTSDISVTLRETTVTILDSKDRLTSRIRHSESSFP